MMKRCWAAELKVLAEISRICHLHQIPWYICGGTLLGAVRHRGFVPWDDDIDIVMTRSDLQRFLSVAEDAALPGYRVFSPLSGTNADNTVSGMSNAGFDRHARATAFYGYPFIASVDIFALDGLYRKEADEARRTNRLLDLDRAQMLLERGDSDTEQLSALLSAIEADNGIRFTEDESLLSQLYKLESGLFSEVPDSEGDSWKLFFGADTDYRYRKEWYSETVLLPFESFELPAPAHWHEVLQADYQDYRQIVIGTSAHDYPGYRKAEALFREKTGHHMLRYTLTRDDFLRSRKAAENGQIALLKETVANAKTQAAERRSAGDAASAEQLLSACIPLEEKITRMSAYGAYDVLILCCGAEWWPSLAPYYEMLSARPDCRILVISIPRYQRAQEPASGSGRDERALFPAHLPLVTPEEYDITACRHPMIITHFPFDGTDLSVSTDPVFYSENLRQYTSCLVYTPCFLPDVPAEKDTVSLSALRTLIEQPAVVFADVVLLAEEGMRRIYIQFLTSCLGEDTRIVWEEKIRLTLPAPERRLP